MAGGVWLESDVCIFSEKIGADIYKAKRDGSMEKIGLFVSNPDKTDKRRFITSSGINLTKTEWDAGVIDDSSTVFEAAYDFSAENIHNCTLKTRWIISKLGRSEFDVSKDILLADFNGIDINNIDHGDEYLTELWRCSIWYAAKHGVIDAKYKGAKIPTIIQENKVDIF